MEKAILINRISQLNYVDGGYDRLYFGQEFCERLIPSVGDLKEALSIIRGKGMAFTLGTPYVTNFGLDKIKPLLQLLNTTKNGTEVIVNDYGILNLVNRAYPNLVPVLGRLLTKQKRGPRLIELLKRKITPRLLKSSQNPKMKYLFFPKKLPLDLDCYYKGSNAASVPIIHDFLVRQRIRRIELDNVSQGLALELPRDRICASVYLPFIYISTTFFCLTAGCDQKEKSLLKVKPCNRQCQKYVFRLRHRTMPRVIYLKGNTQFYKNTRLRIKEWESLGVNRIVHQPQIPV